MKPSLLGLWIACVAFGTACQHTSPKPAGGVELDGARRSLVQALRKAQAIDPDRLVSHLSHTCSLEFNGRLFPVVELQELVPGAMTPRGVNTILLLSPELTVLQRINITSERPLFCVANRLYVWGDLQVDELASEGNELTFEEDGLLVSVRHVEAKDVPAWPAASPGLR
jgi:hypothetical protein